MGVESVKGLPPVWRPVGSVADRPAVANRPQSGLGGVRLIPWVEEMAIPPVDRLRRMESGVITATDGSSSRRIRVALADDQELVRAGLRMMLEREPDIEIVGEAETGEAAVELVKAELPDVILMDIRMPGCGGIAATERITALDVSTRVLMVSTYDHDEVVYSSIRAGAAGFVAKSMHTGHLIDAVRTVADGGGSLTPAITRRVLSYLADLALATDPVDGPLRELSEREVDVLRLIGLGLNNQEIAEQLTIGEPTVKSHVSSILRKLHLRDRVKAAIAAYEYGLIRPGDRP